MPFKKIASLFVDIEESPESKDDAAKTAEAPPPPGNIQGSPAAGAQFASQVPAPSPMLMGSVNEEMAEMLSNTIEAANMEGFDYFEFRESLAKMAAAPLTEAQKYQAVYATAQTVGLSREKLLNSIDYYQGVLNQKKSEFQSHVDAKIAHEVTAREQQKAQNQQRIEKLANEMQAITQEITTLQGENKALDDEMIQANQQIQSTASSFEATFNVVSGRLQEDKNKIATYIPESN